MRTFVALRSVLWISLVAMLGCGGPAGSTDGDVRDGGPVLDGAVPDADVRDAAARDVGPGADAACAVPDRDHDGVISVACGGMDCDDLDGDRFPGHPEVCDADGHDEDCDSSTFGRQDADGDGFVDAACCNVGTCGDDCDDTRATAFPGGAERCDAHDDDCDGTVDEGTLLAFYGDADGDGHGAPTATTTACTPPTGYVASGDDCDDAAPTVHPGATDDCDLVDDDCDGAFDETGIVRYFLDADADGHGRSDTASSMVAGCHAPSGYAASSDDCDDARGDVSPGLPELCDARDNDCSVPSSNGVDTTEDADGDLHSPIGATCASGFPRDDCDDRVAGGFPGVPIVPTLVSPHNGVATGSYRAAARGTLRPTFRWSTDAACASSLRFDLQVDDSCATSAYATCTFPSPELALTGLTTTSATPTTDLAVSTTAPIGRRYFWRVRACDATHCGAWTRPRYLDVGQAPNDINGDGYSDVAIGAPKFNTRGSTLERGAVSIVLGSASGAPSGTGGYPILATDGSTDALGSGLALGDFDADGYSDLVVRGRTRVDVYRGGPTVSTTPTWLLMVPTSPPAAASAVGDTNGDGYDDFVVGQPDPSSPHRSRILVFEGGPSGPSTLPSRSVVDAAEQVSDFGVNLAAGGDLDDDGCADVVVAASSMYVRGGTVYAVLGSFAGLRGAPSGQWSGTTDTARLGEVLALVDTDGDGLDDLVASEPGAASGGTVRVIRRPMSASSIETRIPSPIAASTGYANDITGCGDVNGDGFGDIVIGFSAVGAIFVHQGGAAGVATTPTARIDYAFPGYEVSSSFGASIALAGDVDADGYSDLVVGAPGYREAYVHEGGVVGLGRTFSTRLVDGLPTGSSPSPPTAYGTVVATVFETLVVRAISVRRPT